MKPAIEWVPAVEEAVAEDIQRDVLDAAAEACEKYAASMGKLKVRMLQIGEHQAMAARTLASLLRGMKP